MIRITYKLALKKCDSFSKNNKKITSYHPIISPLKYVIYIVEINKIIGLKIVKTIKKKC